MPMLEYKEDGTPEIGLVNGGLGEVVTNTKLMLKSMTKLMLGLMQIQIGDTIGIGVIKECTLIIEDISQIVVDIKMQDVTFTLILYTLENILKFKIYVIKYLLV